mgnify:CR=1 FL=1
MGYLDAVKKVYRDSLKPNDIFWNVYVARPLAAPLVLMLSRTSITPNQVTFLGAIVFMGVIASLILVPDWQGMLLAAFILELAYIFDCADGQLARITKKTHQNTASATTPNTQTPKHQKPPTINHGDSLLYLSHSAVSKAKTMRVYQYQYREQDEKESRNISHFFIELSAFKVEVLIFSPFDSFF